MKRRAHRALSVGLLLLLLTLAQAGGVQAGDWLTKGGNWERHSSATDPTGLTTLEEAWGSPLELGQSATQPVVLGRTIYHLAGPYLWRIQLTESGDVLTHRALANGNRPWPEPVNMLETGLTMLAQSTPTYSPQSQRLYFGTAYGRLWSYNLQTGRFDGTDLEGGCPIVGSPLVIHAYGEEFIVVADRPNFPDEKTGKSPDYPLCERGHGQVWLVWNMGPKAKKVPYEGPHTRTEGGFGGFITPSAVPAKWPEGPGLVIGADGFSGGRAIGLSIRRTGTDTFALSHRWQVDGSSGFAGTFASDGNHAYWLDTNGFLWAAKLSDGEQHANWPTRSLNLPALIGADAAFTNTEPALVRRADGTHLFLTLRNWTGPGAPPLRGGPTGSDGAALAITPAGQLAWARRFGPADRDSAGRMASVNTAPLAIPAANALLFGDVNGSLYSMALASANRNGGHAQPFLVAAGSTQAAATMHLLKPGEQPARGGFNFSQISGVGVDPAMGAGLLLVGVNYTRGSESGGRLVAYRVAPAYNLRWTNPPPAQPLTLTPEKPYPYANQVTLELIDQPLSAICGATPTVTWYVADESGYRRQLATTPLPAGLAPGRPHPVQLDLTLTRADPAAGQIVGIIDHPTVLALGGTSPADPAVALARQLQGETAPAVTCRQGGGRASEIVAVPDRPGALNGLADNLIAIPYKRSAPQDDPFIAALIGPPSPIATGTFGIVPHLGYWNNLGHSAVTVTLIPSGRLDEVVITGAPMTVTINRDCCSSLPEPIIARDLAPGEWEITVELIYPGDTNLKNNRKTITVVVLPPSAPRPLPSYGSVLNN